MKVKPCVEALQYSTGAIHATCGKKANLQRSTQEELSTSDYPAVATNGLLDSSLKGAQLTTAKRGRTTKTDACNALRTFNFRSTVNLKDNEAHAPELEPPDFSSTKPSSNQTSKAPQRCAHHDRHVAERSNDYRKCDDEKHSRTKLGKTITRGRWYVHTADKNMSPFITLPRCKVLSRGRAALQADRQSAKKE